VADDLERPAEPVHEDSEQHLPAPTILPFAFAGGIALILIGLIINWWLAVAGGILALLFGFAWIREVTRDVRAAPEPEPVVVDRRSRSGTRAASSSSSRRSGSARPSARSSRCRRSAS
jgi:hypothetical protein